MRTRVNGTPRGLLCWDCGMRIAATIEQAKRHGWQVWVGGARCKSCADKGTVAVVDDPKEDVRIHLRCVKCGRRHHILAVRCDQCGAKLVKVVPEGNPLGRGE